MVNALEILRRGKLRERLDRKNTCLVGLASYWNCGHKVKTGTHGRKKKLRKRFGNYLLKISCEVGYSTPMKVGLVSMLNKMQDRDAGRARQKRG